MEDTVTVLLYVVSSELTCSIVYGTEVSNCTITSELVSLITYGNGGDYYDYTGSYRLDYDMPWIENTMASIPEPMTLTLLAFGTLAALKRRRS